MEFIANAEDVGERLDKVLAHCGPFSRAEARELIAQGLVFVNDAVCRKSQRIAANDKIRVEGSAARDFVPFANHRLDLSVVYEDAHIVVVNKAPGMACHPLRENDQATVVNALLARYPEMKGVGNAKREAGILHRLDIDTSGLLIAARNQ